MPDDFAIGIDVSIYGRAMRIYDADDYTREFFQVSRVILFRYNSVRTLAHWDSYLSGNNR